MSKVRIVKDDYNKILLTELLPYEVPLIFSNDGFYDIVKSSQINKYIPHIKRLGLKSWSIPFSYDIRKQGGYDSRTLSVIHPFIQLRFVEFYKKYDNTLTHLCAKSPFSLRRIHKIAKFFYAPNMVVSEDEHKTPEVEVEPEVLDCETKYLKSYFTYKPIDLIYKFYEQTEFQRLEQRFVRLLQFDISKCFYNIYTHSITWAIKGKDVAKNNATLDDLLENRFDKLMQQCNYNETNGILVGPEISRIFAEIILQQIDVDVIKALGVCGVKLGVHYEVRRYVDDFFVFTNDSVIEGKVLKQYADELKKYKLYINPSKNQFFERPFISTMAMAKREVRVKLIALFDQYIYKNEDGAFSIREIRKPYSISKNFIKDFQSVVKTRGLGYEVVNRDVLRYMKTILVRIIQSDNHKTPEGVKQLENLLLVILDIGFYAYSLDINSSSTFKISQIIVLIDKYISVLNESTKHTISSKIIKEVNFCLDIYLGKIKENETNIEILNLLISMRVFETIYPFSQKRLEQLFGIKELCDYEKLNYFQICSLLYYIGDDKQYEDIRNKIEAAVFAKFSHTQMPFTKAEYTLLFFDYICCPYVSKNSKKQIVEVTEYGSPKNSLAKVAEIAKEKQWFMCWDNKVDMERVLKKKEWSSVY